MPEKIIQRKCFVINTAYILIAAMLVLLTILTAGLLMPFWIALFLSAILQPITRLLSGKLEIKKKGLFNMFKKGIAFITAVALVTSGIVFTPSNADAAVNSNQGSNSWKLVWSDEFNQTVGQAPDTSV